MNLTDLHYVVEIDKSGSISKAAKELYVAQPNLSKAIKHLEREFGISIFERSSKGVKATREGQKFLEYAKRIIYEIEEMKRDCSDLGKENLSFKITVPRASYITSAFAEFIGMQSKETAIKAEFQENSSMHAIENVLQNGYSMGIIRYLCENEPYFQSLLDLKGLDAELLAELPYVILTSADGDLAKRELKTREEVVPYGKKLQEMGARNVLISMAGEGAVLIAEDRQVFDKPAPKGHLVNAVGAGDSMVAGFMAGWMDKQDYEHAFCMGIASGSASAFSEYLATKSEIEAIYKQVRVED